MRALRLTLFAAVLLWVPQASAQAELTGGIGILGDSFSDEYQFYPPDRTRARNWVEILAATRHLNFGRWSKASRGEPRNQGFEYNWARSDATTDDMISSGQHTGLAAQVARGEVKLVVMFIGGNDFIAVFRSPDPWATLASATPRAKRNFAVALATILDANPNVRVVVGTVPDVCELPEFKGSIRDGRVSPGLPEAIDRAIRDYNAQIRRLAAQDNRVAVVDFYMTAKVVGLIAKERLMVAGQTIDRVYTGNGLNHFFLSDNRHAGSVGQGMMAKLIVDTINAKYGTGIRPLSEQEIVDHARSVDSSRPVLAGNHADPAVSRASWEADRSPSAAPEPNPPSNSNGEKPLSSPISLGEEVLKSLFKDR